MTRTFVLYGPRLSLVMLRSQQAQLIFRPVTAAKYTLDPRLHQQGAASHMYLLKVPAA